MLSIKDKISKLATAYSKTLDGKITLRMSDMDMDDNSHYLIYQVLGIKKEEGRLIDLYQNKGRFLYKYAGAFLEEATFQCFKEKFPSAQRNVKVKNLLGQRPKTFEIDCLVDTNAYEIKWRDATTDGDHITKEHTRVKVIEQHKLKPIRIMFYYPNRTQAIRIQNTLETIYKGVNGEYYAGDNAWQYILEITNIDLKHILLQIAEEKTKNK